MKFTFSTAFLFSMVAMAMAAASTISEIKCVGGAAVKSCSADFENASSVIQFNEDATDEGEYYGVLTTDNERCADLEARFPNISGCNPDCEITACTDTVSTE